MVRASGTCLEGPGFNPQSGHLFCLTQRWFNKIWHVNGEVIQCVWIGFNWKIMVFDEIEVWVKSRGATGPGTGINCLTQCYSMFAVQAWRTGCLDLTRDVIISWTPPAANEGVQKMKCEDLDTMSTHDRVAGKKWSLLHHFDEWEHIWLVADDQSRAKCWQADFKMKLYAGSADPSTSLYPISYPISIYLYILIIPPYY